MDMREKTIKALEKAIQCFERYSGDEYGREYNYTHVEVEVLEYAVALLKAQEQIEPKIEILNEIDRIYCCPTCHKALFYAKQKYCDRCGQAVKWE